MHRKKRLPYNKNERLFRMLRLRKIQKKKKGVNIMTYEKMTYGKAIDTIEHIEEHTDEPVEEQEGETSEEGGEESFALAGQIVSAIYEALSGITYTDEWGTCSKYWYYDHDAELSEIYVHDSEDYSRCVSLSLE